MPKAILTRFTYAVASKAWPTGDFLSLVEARSLISLLARLVFYIILSPTETKKGTELNVSCNVNHVTRKMSLENKTRYNVVTNN